jgi:uncharacterized protein YneR
MKSLSTLKSETSLKHFNKIREIYSTISEELAREMASNIEKTKNEAVKVLIKNDDVDFVVKEKDLYQKDKIALDELVEEGVMEKKFIFYFENLCPRISRVYGKKNN